MEIKTGDTLEYKLAERPLRMGGLVDPSCTLPAEKHVVEVRRVTKTKRGLKAHVKPGPHGFSALMVEQLSEFATLSKVAA